MTYSSIVTLKLPSQSTKFSVSSRRRVKAQGLREPLPELRNLICTSALKYVVCIVESVYMKLLHPNTDVGSSFISCG